MKSELTLTGRAGSSGWRGSAGGMSAGGAGCRRDRQGQMDGGGGAIYLPVIPSRNWPCDVLYIVHNLYTAADQVVVSRMS